MVSNILVVNQKKAQERVSSYQSKILALSLKMFCNLLSPLSRCSERLSICWSGYWKSYLRDSFYKALYSSSVNLF